jgi:hypothetical protein
VDSDVLAEIARSTGATVVGGGCSAAGRVLGGRPEQRRGVVVSTIHGDLLW